MEILHNWLQATLPTAKRPYGCGPREVEGEGEVEVEKMRGKKNHAMGVIECTYYFGASN
jgi:hypothetical protein